VTRVSSDRIVASATLWRLKSGAPARGERVAKYNRLIEIEATEPELRCGIR